MLLARAVEDLRIGAQTLDPVLTLFSYFRFLGADEYPNSWRGCANDTEALSQ